MSQEFLTRIFEPFVQADTDARSVYQGTGLGMSIAKALIEQMGGTLEISSELNVGSRFVVTIPFELYILVGTSHLCLWQSAASAQSDDEYLQQLY